MSHRSCEPAVRDEKVVGAMRTPAARTEGVAAALTAALAVAGCSSAGGVKAQGPVIPATTAAPTPTSTSDSTPSRSPSATNAVTPESANILRQYKAFFASLTPLSRASNSARLAAMQKLATDPELTRVIGGLAASTQAGEVLYGSLVLRPKIQSKSPTTATIIDCQDSSGNGRMVAATGHKVTVGRVNDLAKVTLTLGPDRIWRVATVDYAAAGSCHASA